MGEHGALLGHPSRRDEVLYRWVGADYRSICAPSMNGRLERMGTIADHLYGFPWRTDVYVKVLAAAVEGGTIHYMELPGGRFHLGKYLARIAAEEARQNRPPLTAVVVEKRTGRPAAGFMAAMKDIGYARDGEAEHEVWRRAIAEVHAFWRRT